ncbi:hypothetical protein B0H17DRAFT_1266238 [Mycena rosella]|uniref:Cytochrome P450 n=1 Tax=Mycena rosella TaxID=1033263 RepID=A0AAD7G4D4_MYCRO|nr:hypothetical protein B0H17DRAFT_1266238 [Mycena rosella]
MTVDCPLCEFKPERWVNGRAGTKDAKMPGVWGGTMTFNGGGRSCIGFKFSQLEMSAHDPLATSCFFELKVRHRGLTIFTLGQGRGVPHVRGHRRANGGWCGGNADGG